MGNLKNVNPVEEYFSAERSACAGGIGISVMAMGLAAYCMVKVKQPFYTGLGWTLLVLGLFFLIICVGVFFRSPADNKRVQDILATNPAQLQQGELPRMDRVMRNFKIIMVVEASLIACSFAVLMFVKLGSASKGAFAGTLIMASILLVFDWLADDRGSEYHEFLKSQIKDPVK